MRRKPILLLLIAAILLVFGVYLDKIAPAATEFTRTLLIATAFAIVAATAALAVRAWREEASDERTEKIERASMAVSWTATWIAVAFLVLGYQFDILTQNPTEILALLFFFMVFLEVIARMYFESRGDV
jgi:hypothetical protein